VSEHDQRDDTDLPIITFENEQGDMIEFAQLIVFELDDKVYAALTPVDELDKDGVELYFFHADEEEAGPTYVPIDDEQLNGRLFDIAVELLGGTAGEE
jgi:uncharacterized protein YrzB (UPF0473 family)